MEALCGDSIEQALRPLFIPSGGPREPRRGACIQNPKAGPVF